MKKMLLSLAIIFAVSLPSIPANNAILDNTGHISQQTFEHVTNGNRQMFAETGGEILFYVTNFVPMGAEIESYSLSIFNEWQIGREDTNNGVLVTIASAEGLAWVTVGEGLHQHMPRAVILNFLNNYFVDYFEQSNYNAAIIALYDAMSAQIYQLFPPNAGVMAMPISHSPTQMELQQDTSNLISLLLVIGVILLILALSGRRRGPRPMGGMGMPMGRRRMGGMGGFFGGFMLGRGMRPRGGVRRPPSVGGGWGAGNARPQARPQVRPPAGRGGYSRGGGGGISRGGGMGRRR